VAGEEAQAYRCRDAKGRTLYSNETCEKQGLKAAGAVKDRITVVPAVATPKASPEKKADKAREARPGASAPVKPINPLIEKLAE
jgi:hypothetical protein